MVDPRCRHKHRSVEFHGAPYTVADVDDDRDEAILHGIRRFIADLGQLPNQKSWTIARMTPSEKTVRNRFGSFKAAAEAAGVRSNRFL
jgi:hypothetical protein